jgi:hypothetical protein
MGAASGEVQWDRSSTAAACPASFLLTSRRMAGTAQMKETVPTTDFLLTGIAQLTWAVAYLIIAIAHLAVLTIALAALWFLQASPTELLATVRGLLPQGLIGLLSAIGFSLLSVAGAYGWLLPRVAGATYRWLIRRATKGL